MFRLQRNIIVNKNITSEFVDVCNKMDFTLKHLDACIAQNRIRSFTVDVMLGQRHQLRVIKEK